MTVYATQADLALLGIAADAYASMDPAVLDAALLRASSMADEYIAQRFTLPLTAWSQQLKSSVCAIAVHDLLAIRGYNPAMGADEVVRLRYDDAMRWLRELRNGDVAGIGLVDSTPTTDETHHVVVVSAPSRRW